MDINSFWSAVLRQDAEEMRLFFADSAYVNWHCTNEHFTAEEFIQANCEYPGKWTGEIERIEKINDLIITATRVVSENDGSAFHAVSFIKTKAGKIIQIDEYWGDDGPAPQWRREKNIGTAITADKAVRLVQS